MSSLISAVVTPVPVITVDDEGPPPPVGTIEYLQRSQRARRREEQIMRLEEQRLQEIVEFCKEYNRESDIFFEKMRRSNPTPERKLDPKYIFSPKKGPKYTQSSYSHACESTYGGSMASTMPSTSTYSFVPYSTSLNKSDEGPMDLSKSGGWSTDSVTSNSSSPSSSTVTGHTLPSVQSSYVNSTTSASARVTLHSSFSPSDHLANKFECNKSYQSRHGATSDKPIICPNEDVTTRPFCQIKSTVSSETLDGLIMESALLQSEIERLRECKTDDADDLDNESLKEFQQMEREIRLTEVTKCLERINEQIKCKQDASKTSHKLSAGSRSREVKSPVSSRPINHIDKEVRDTAPAAFRRANGRLNGSSLRSSMKKSKPLANFNNPSDDDDEDEEDNDDASGTLTETEDNSSDSDGGDTPRMTLSVHDTRKASSLPPSDLYSLSNVRNNVRAFSVKPSTHSISSNDSSSRAMSSSTPNSRHSHTAKSGLIGEMVLLGHNLNVFMSDEVQLTCCTCSGYLWKLTSNKKKWKKRFFHFDRHHRVFFYYKNLDQFRKVKKPNGGVIFADLRDVWIDRSNGTGATGTGAAGAGDLSRTQSMRKQKPLNSHLPISPLTRSNSLMRASFRSLKHATLGRKNKKKDDKDAASSNGGPSDISGLSKSSEDILSSPQPHTLALPASSSASVTNDHASKTKCSPLTSLPPLHPNSTGNSTAHSNNNILCKSNNSPLNKVNNNNINNKNNHCTDAHSFVFVVDTAKRSFVLSAHSWQLMRLWIDVIFTGVDSYCD